MNIDPRKKDMSKDVAYFLRLAEKGNFQTRTSLNSEEKTKIIENILLKLPLSSVIISTQKNNEVFYREATSDLSVVIEFLQNDFALTSPFFFKELDCLTASEIPPRKFNTLMDIKVHYSDIFENSINIDEIAEIESRFRSTNNPNIIKSNLLDEEDKNSNPPKR